MYNQPQRAKRLYFDVIPRAVDEYIANTEKARTQSDSEQQTNPVWLLNLASVANADTPDILWGFIRRYSPEASSETEPMLARLVEHAIAYYHDFVRVKKQFREPEPFEREALLDLAATLAALPPDATAETQPRISATIS